MTDERGCVQCPAHATAEGKYASKNWYVYVYRDPDDSLPFYVGKGTDLRVFSHANGYGSKETDSKIEDIRARGKEPKIEIVARNLSEEMAYVVEMALIEFVGIGSLTNKQHGRGHKEHGRIESSRLQAYLEGEALEEESFRGCPTIVFRINRLYQPDMVPEKLYDITRGFWGVNLVNAERCKYAMCAYEGRILEIYEVTAWFAAGTTFMSRRLSKGDCNRKEFAGRICEDSKIRKKFLGKSISRLQGYESRKEFLYFGIENAQEA